MYSEIETREERPRILLSKLLILIGIFFLGQVVGGAVGLIAVVLGFGIRLEDMMEVLQGTKTHPQSFWIWMVLQGIASVITFIFGSWLFLQKVENQEFKSLNPRPQIQLTPALLTVFLIFFSFPLSGFLVQLTQMIDFTKLGGIGNWIVEKETEIGNLTKQLTDFQSFSAFLTGFLVIVIIPAIGEELLFRGLMQPILLKLTKNIHWAVWVTAAIFSFIHFQFYGFLSRMLLGAMLGYLYVWSGNIFYPMLAHFANNGFQAVLLYLYQQKMITYNIDEETKIPITWALVSLILIVLLMLAFRKTTAQKNNFQPS